MKKLILDSLLGLARRQAEPSGSGAHGLHGMVEGTRREAAMLAAAMVGTQEYVGQFAGLGSGRSRLKAERRQFADLVARSPMPCLVLDPRPGLHIVDMNDLYAEATLVRRRSTCGSKMFDIYPDNPDLPHADGVSNLFESLRQVSRTGVGHAMPVQRYDVCGPDGRFEVRYWRPSNTPVLDEEGNLAFIVHQAVDVTDLVLASPPRALGD